ncbi:hypothetical protein Tco_1283902 [Tanacetum coccineum]
MSGSEPGEMAPESSRAVVLPKFDMHIYTSKFTPSELKEAIGEYCIPPDLHPRLPPLGMMINRLPSRYISLYIEQLEQGVNNMDTLLKLTTWVARAPKKKQRAALEAAKKPATVEKEVVDLSGNTRASTPPVMNTQPSLNHEQHDTYKAKDEFLGALSNVEVVSRAYQTLGQSVVAQGELLKRHEQLNHNHVDLLNRNDAYLSKLDSLRLRVRRVEHDNEGLVNKLDLLENAHLGCESREKELTDGLKDLERRRDEWQATASNQVEQIRSLEKDIEHKTRPLEIAEEKIRILKDEKLALSAKLA